MGNSHASPPDNACPLAQSECTVGSRIDALSEEIETLKEQVNTDPLTGLFNVRHMRYALEQELERSQRTQQPTSLIIVDADHFKHVNDTYGHVVGDRALKHLASLILSTVRKIDVPCRYGGEEFTIILPSTPLLMGIQVAERIRKKVEETPLQNNDKTLSFTISAGVDTYHQSIHHDIETFIAEVDAQLYRAKSSGRNCVAFGDNKPAQQAKVSADEKQALFDQLNDKDQ